MQIKDDKIEGVRFVSLKAGNKIVPSLIVIHFTGGSTVDGSITSMKNNNYSAHVIVDRDGVVTQLIPFNKRANHAGKSTWRGKDGCNNYSIGIEIANWGALHKNAKDEFLSWVDSKVDPSNVIMASHKLVNPDGSHGLVPWEKYYAPQIKAVTEIISCLGQKYPTILEVVGHDDVSPYRKNDPGPAAPIIQWRNALRPAARTEDGAPDKWRVSCPGGLNVRSGPGTNFDRIDRLDDKTELVVTTGKKEWRYVTYTKRDNLVSGWVHYSYLTDI